MEHAGQIGLLVLEQMQVLIPMWLVFSCGLRYFTVHNQSLLFHSGFFDWKGHVLLLSVCDAFIFLKQIKILKGAVKPDGLNYIKIVQ